MANRLSSATSPYLLQHADNPVEWWEWEPAAFEEARQRNLPILLSVGYAACHWCHVMAHESFEDPDTAAYLNEHFVAIKVDREERPDIDAIYMQATTAMTGQGGWPMTCVLDHEGTPFFAGTYFPPRPRGGQPSFRQVLEAISDAWSNRSEDIARVGMMVRDHVRAAQASLVGTVDEALLAGAERQLAGEFDERYAGFGGAPKFPPSMVLEFLRQRAAAGSEEARTMADRTLAAMLRGGIYDQLGGGFARYSVDARWVVPHFEKMLYDNAQLLGVLARRGTPLASRAAAETADFLLRELSTGEGGFASALDADSEGVEGRFYVWTPAELRDVLGADDAEWAAELFGVTDEGTFEHGSSTLRLPRDPGDAARFDGVRRRLLVARETRVRPARDDKVVAAWNGLAITGLVDAGVRLGRPDLLDAAAAAGRLLWDLHWTGDRLMRVSRDGVVGRHAGVLEDYGCVAAGFLSLVQATADPTWLTRAQSLLEVALERFRAPDGGFFDTADDAEALLARPRDVADNASPSGHSAVVGALVTYAAITGSQRHRAVADEALASAAGLLARAPRFAGWSLAVAQAMATGPEEIAVVGAPGPARDALAAAARNRPGAVVVVAAAAVDGIPLLQSRSAVGGHPTAYVCRHHVCAVPVTDPADLAP